MFDSINHLPRPAAWRRVFHRAGRHLNDRRVFIFDVNTSGKLQRLVEAPAWEKSFGRDLAIIKLHAQRSGVFEWDVKVFEHETRQRYKLLHEIIREIALPQRQILESLRHYFRQVKALDPFGFKPSDRSERLYFVGKPRRC